MKLPPLLRYKTKNTVVPRSLGQWFREYRCEASGHVFYVAWGDGYLGLPQSHCFRCGIVGPMAIAGSAKWIPPLG